MQERRETYSSASRHTSSLRRGYQLCPCWRLCRLAPGRLALCWVQPVTEIGVFWWMTMPFWAVNRVGMWSLAGTRLAILTVR